MDAPVELNLKGIHNVYYTTLINKTVLSTRSLILIILTIITNQKNI
jgi:hypothetical protein